MAIPPQPKGRGNLKVQKVMYRSWIAAGGQPPIYGPVFPVPRPATLVGGTIANPATLLATLQAITDAGFIIGVNGPQRIMGPADLTGVTSLSDVAAMIDAGLNDATCVYMASPARFVITTVATGPGASLTFAGAPPSGTNVSVTLQLTAASGATLTQGSTLSRPQAAADEPEAVTS